MAETDRLVEVLNLDAEIRGLRLWLLSYGGIADQTSVRTIRVNLCDMELRRVQAVEALRSGRRTIREHAESSGFRSRIGQSASRQEDYLLPIV